MYMRTINEKYINDKITNPLTGKDVWVRFIQEIDYPFYYSLYPHIFIDDITELKYGLKTIDEK